MPPTKNPDEARANDIAQKSESMARELSQKREMRIRQERVRHLSSDDSAPGSAGGSAGGSSGGGSRRSKQPSIADDKTVRADDVREPPRSVRPQQPAAPPFYPERRPSMLDEVATELEELFRDLRSGFRRWQMSDKITFTAALATLAGVLMPWISDKTRAFELGIVAGGGFHAALACAAIALLVQRTRQSGAKGERRASARRTSLWHLMLGAASTLLCAYFLVIYGLQRSAATGLEIRYGLYVTLGAGMGLSYGGFARFWSRHSEER